MSEISDVKTEEIEISKIDLDLENPRHEPFGSEEEAIRSLCENEKVLALARDIVEHGLNPVERFALIQKEDGRYFTAEGNRRLCALKLLNNPQLAPQKFRGKFLRTSSGWEPIGTIEGVIFSSREDVAIWLERIHSAGDKGRGRRPWSRDQQKRHFGDSRKNLALAVLDWGEERGLITKEGRKRRLTVVERYLSNPIVREALGLVKKEGAYYLEFSEEDALSILGKFLDDIASRRLNTRIVLADRIEYARKLRDIEGYPSERLADPVPLTGEDVAGPESKKQETNKDKKTIKEDTATKDSANYEKRQKGGHVRHSKPRRIPENILLKKALEEIGVYKVHQLYYSICSIDVQKHTPLLTVGVWSLMDSMVELAGRKNRASFSAFFSNDLLSKYGVEKKNRGTVREVLERLSLSGNSTKHSATASNFQAEQLIADFQTVEGLLIRLAGDIMNARSDEDRLE